MVIELVLRTLLIYVVLLAVMRIMGKREVGQLSPSDLVVAIVIAELASIPIEQRDISILHGLIPIATLMFAEILLSWLSLKSLSVRKIISGTPTIVIAQGRILENELRHQRYNIHDMLSQLRDKGIANVADVEYAILEPSGRLSVFLKSDKRPLNPADVHIIPPYEGLPIPLIVDGQIIETNLRKINRDKNWLGELLRNEGFQGPEEVLFANLDAENSIYISPKDNYKKEI